MPKTIEENAKAIDTTLASENIKRLQAVVYSMAFAAPEVQPMHQHRAAECINIVARALGLEFPGGIGAAPPTEPLLRCTVTIIEAGDSLVVVSREGSGREIKIPSLIDEDRRAAAHVYRKALLTLVAE